MVEKKKRKIFLMLTREDVLDEQLTAKQRKRNIFVLAVSTLFAGSANSIHFILYAPYFQEIETSQTLFGLIGTLASIISVIGLITSDYLNNAIGFKRVLLVGQLLVAASFMFFIFRPNRIFWIIIAVMILSFAFSLTESPANIILTETAGEKQKGKISSITSLFGRIGEIIVSILITSIATVIVFSNADRSWFYIYSAAIYIFIFVLMFFFITDPVNKEKNNLEEEEDQEEASVEKQLPDDLENEPVENEPIDNNSRTAKKSGGFLRSFIEAFKDKWVLRVALTFFADAFLWSLGLGVHWSVLNADYGFTDDKISLMILITSITVLVVMLPSGWLVDKVGAKHLLYTSEFCGIIWVALVIVFAFYSYLWIMILARIALGLSVALWIPSTIALFTNVETKRKSKVYNSIAIFRTIGWIPGGIVAGLIYDAFPLNHRMGFLTPLIILIIGQFFLIFIFLKLPNKPPQNNQEAEIATE
ncbi:MAG: MFS transporter [Candidatus Heimdallarchaeota archaeon]